MVARHKEVLLRTLLLISIYILAIATRLGSLAQYGKLLNGFDPFFNYSATQLLASHGPSEFRDWFDHTSWHPLGRVVGESVYPGLMAVAAGVHWGLTKIGSRVSLRDVCILLPPFLAANTAMAGYMLGAEVGGCRVGLTAAALLAVAPGFVQKTTAGSFDNEALGVLFLLLTFACFLIALRKGSMFWALAASMCHGCTAASWGGYVFSGFIIPIYILTLALTGRFSQGCYLAGSIFSVLGTLFAAQVPCVRFGAVRAGESFPLVTLFVGLQVQQLATWVSVPKARMRRGSRRLQLSVVVKVCCAVLWLAAASQGRTRGFILPWRPQTWALIDPLVAGASNPLLASVAEHQPTTWASFFFDLHCLVMWAPVGLFSVFQRPTESRIFAAVLGTAALHLAGVMVRLMLLLAPAFSILGAVGLSDTLFLHLSRAREAEVGAAIAAEDSKKAGKRSGKGKKRSGAGLLPFQAELGWMVAALVGLSLQQYMVHCRWVAAKAYSKPTLVLASSQSNGSRLLFDDFREAYGWLRFNTPPESKVVAWWDYGYQIASMADRGTIVDNSAWNSSRIGLVGRLMASPEEAAAKMMHQLEADYILVVFGGFNGYQSDDINKFLWMVRIAEAAFPDKVSESDYVSPSGDITIDSTAAQAMTSSLLYRLSYYRFGGLRTGARVPPGLDRVRMMQPGLQELNLTHFEEAFTTSSWMVRIYQTLPRKGL